MRDPRTDPRPGDVLRKGNRVRLVLAPPRGWKRWPRVRFAQHPPRFLQDESPGVVSSAVFLAWAKDATVLHVADDKPARAAARPGEA